MYIIVRGEQAPKTLYQLYLHTYVAYSGLFWKGKIFSQIGLLGSIDLILTF